MALTVTEWKRRHSRLIARWPNESNNHIPAFMLRAAHEPYFIKPSNLAIVADDWLAGRFSYRIVDDMAFVGLYLQPEARNKGIALEASCLSVRKVINTGVKVIWCSVAAPNRPAIWLNTAVGYRLTGDEDWRCYPDGFTLDMLLKWNTSHWRMLPEPAILYKRMVLDVSGWGNRNLARL